jgi:hypothetical protein
MSFITKFYQNKKLFLCSVYFSDISINKGAGVAQPVWRLGYGLEDRVSIADRVNYGIFTLQIVQIASGA